MVQRSFWTHLIESSWKTYPIVWLSGVRRSGKTVLCSLLEGCQYLDCELPSVRRRLEDPESFLDSPGAGRVIIDEVHRLHNPSELLKIAADHYPHLRIVATGSSSLGASKKFRDTLTGRKCDLLLTPMLQDESAAFQPGSPIEHRMLHGGLPPFFLAEAPVERHYQDWMDSFWAKDIQELFRLERRYSFIHFVELVLARSATMFEATRYASECEASRTTIANYLSVLEATHVAHVVRPFNTHRSAEIVSAPKIYGFDTGFVCCFKGWTQLRSDDKGILWEHLVLNELVGRLQTLRIRYWRDKRHHEIDFVVPHRDGSADTIECKWHSRQFETRNIDSFRQQYPHGRNFVVCHDIKECYRTNHNRIKLTFVGLAELISALQTHTPPAGGTMPGKGE